jgi:hypothetical protein
MAMFSVIALSSMASTYHPLRAQLTLIERLITLGTSEDDLGLSIHFGHFNFDSNRPGNRWCRGVVVLWRHFYDTESLPLGAVCQPLTTRNPLFNEFRRAEQIVQCQASTDDGAFCKHHARYPQTTFPYDKCQDRELRNCKTPS